MFENFDGSGRPPRPAQLPALNWLQANKERKRKAFVGPVGLGKSAILRAYQLEYGGVIVPPVNVLADQLEGDYPSVNMLKGLSNYHCAEYDENCETVRALNNKKSCGNCEYTRRRQCVLNAEPSIVNPVALFYTKQSPHTPYSTVMIDEAHKLLSLLEMLCQDEFSFGRYSPPEDLTDVQKAATWIRKQARMYADLSAKYSGEGDFRKQLKAAKRCAALSALADQLDEQPDNFVAYYEERVNKSGPEKYFIVAPIEVPRGLIDATLGPYQDLILVSATLPKRWAERIFGTDDFAYTEVESPIPDKNRPVYVRPAGLTAKSEPREVAAWIAQQMERHPGNTIVHVTYSMGKRLKEFFPHALLHTSETKDETMKKFKREGGMWLAPGCAEGIDLPGDQARTNLIPILPFANIGSPLVAARMAKPRGRDDYELDTLIQTIQAAGRTTRGPDDWSNTVIGDARIMRLINNHRSQVPKSFCRVVKYER